GDPEGVAMGDEAGERRDQAAAAAPHGALAALVELELGRAAVGDDDQRVAAGHGPTLPGGCGPDVNAVRTRWSRHPGRPAGEEVQATRVRARVAGRAQGRGSRRAGPVVG